MDFMPATKRLMTPTRLYLMRHGQVVGYEKKRINGHDDVKLTQEGILQSGRLGRRLKGEEITAIYSSDLSRAAEGARIIGQHLGITPAPPLEGLREKAFGAFEGLTLEEIQEQFSIELDELMKSWIDFRAPGAESLEDLERRVSDVLAEILERHRGERIAVMAHGGVNRVILLRALEMKLEKFFHFEQDYGCLNIIDYYPHGVLIRLLNGTDAIK